MRRALARLRLRLARGAAALRLHLGGFERLRAVEPERVARLVFICKGNVCRSPYGEAVARRLGFTAVSAGLATRGGVRANLRARAVALLRGQDLSGHRSRPLTALTLGPGDLLVVMEPAQARAVAAAARSHGAQVTLLGLWERPPRPIIDDPFGADRAAFADCFGRIEAAVAGLATALRRVPAGPTEEAESRA